MKNVEKEKVFGTFTEDTLNNTQVIKGGPETDRGTVVTVRIDKQ